MTVKIYSNKVIDVLRLQYETCLLGSSQGREDRETATERETATGNCCSGACGEEAAGVRREANKIDRGDGQAAGRVE